MTNVVLLAAYRLPLPLTLDSEALNVVFPSRVGGLPAEVLFPLHQDEDETLDVDDVMFLRAGGRDRAPDRVLTVVNGWEGARRGPDGSGDLAWHPRAPNAGAKQARRLYLRVLSEDLELEPPRVGAGPSVERAGG